MNPCKIPSKFTVHIYIMDEIKILFPLLDLGPKTHNEKLISKNISKWSEKFKPYRSYLCIYLWKFLDFKV